MCAKYAVFFSYFHKRLVETANTFQLQTMFQLNKSNYKIFLTVHILVSPHAILSSVSPCKQIRARDFF